MSLSVFFANSDYGINMNKQAKSNLFLKTSDIPKNIPIAWAIIDIKFNLLRLSEAFFVQVNKPISLILNQSLSKCFSSLDISSIELPMHEPMLLNWVDDKGKGIQGVFTSIPDSPNLWSLKISELNLDEKWLMNLHPDYHHAIQSSDEWLTQIEKVILSEPELVFQIAVEQAITLTSSQIGYLHLYDEKKSEISLTTWSDSAVALCQIPKARQLSESDAGLWFDCIRKRKAAINNDCSSVKAIQELSTAPFELSRHMSVPIIYRNRVVGVIGVGNRDLPYTHVDAKSLSVFASIIWHCVELPRSMRVLSKQSKVIKTQREQLTSTLVRLIGAVSEAVELKDAYTAGHQKSVAQLAYLIGERLGLSEERLEGLKLGALIHDIGKLGIPTQILCKPSKLSEEEFALVKLHPEKGANVISEVEFPWPIKEMILQHHERLDGSGYPKGLKGDEIILEAKIIGIADVADSVLSHRPYRPSLGMGKLKEILLSGKGQLFDANIVDICIDILVSHQIENVQYVSQLPLEPVICIEPDHTLAEVRQLLVESKAKIAVVRDGPKGEVIGLIDQTILDAWRSPLLDTASERTVDRKIENKRIHQVMRHKLPLVTANTILKDAKLQLENETLEYLVVVDGEEPYGCVNWKIMANAQSLDFDSELQQH